ncbi:MAG: hypothetical protein QXR87_06830 [Candidatus Hadarchaeales archaeon]
MWGEGGDQVNQITPEEAAKARAALAAALKEPVGPRSLEEEVEARKRREARARGLLRAGVVVPEGAGFRCTVCGRSFAPRALLDHDPEEDLRRLVPFARAVAREAALDRALGRKVDPVVAIGKKPLSSYVHYGVRALFLNPQVRVQGRGLKVALLGKVFQSLGAKEVSPGTWALPPQAPGQSWAGIEVVRKTKEL